MLPAFFPWIGLHSIYIVSMTALGIFMLALNVWLLFNPSATSAWTVFKISSPYLFLAFVMFMLDVLVH
jgi:heme O synthase-like polyprenyltransferase